MDTSLLDAGQYDPENASQWTPLPSHEQAQHRTLEYMEILPHNLPESTTVSVGITPS
jgi:hypothetical protein